MTARQNTAEGYTSSPTAVSTANSGGASGDAFTSVTTSGGSTITATSAKAANGTYAYRVYQDPAAVTAAYMVWNNTSLGTIASDYGGFNALFETTPATFAAAMMTARDTTLNVERFRMQIRTDDRLQLQIAGASVDHESASSSFDTVLTKNAWFGVDWRYIGDTTLEVRLFTNIASSTPTETHTYTSVNLGPSYDNIRWGNPLGSHFGATGLYLDDLRAGQAAWTTRGTGAPGNARLNWTAASRTGTTVVSYKPREAGVVLATLGPSVFTYLDTSATPGTSYDVVATFADGTTATSTPKVYTT